jgi:hypothetical protein
MSCVEQVETSVRKHDDGMDCLIQRSGNTQIVHQSPHFSRMIFVIAHTDSAA